MSKKGIKSAQPDKVYMYVLIEHPMHDELKELYESSLNEVLSENSFYTQLIISECKNVQHNKTSYDMYLNSYINDIVNSENDPSASILVNRLNILFAFIGYRIKTVENKYKFVCLSKVYIKKGFHNFCSITKDGMYTPTDNNGRAVRRKDNADNNAVYHVFLPVELIPVKLGFSRHNFEYDAAGNLLSIKNDWV